MFGGEHSRSLQMCHRGYSAPPSLLGPLNMHRTTLIGKESTIIPKDGQIKHEICKVGQDQVQDIGHMKTQMNASYSPHKLPLWVNKTSAIPRPLTWYDDVVVGVTKISNQP